MHKLRMHPDLGGDHEHAALMNEAFAVLSSPERRAAYDRDNESCAPKPSQESLLLCGRVRAPVSECQPARKPAVRKPVTYRECPFCRARRAPSPDLQDAECYRCQSPLFPVTLHQESAASKRAIERLPRRMVITCTDAHHPGVNLQMMTEDVSIRGMCIVSPHQLSPGQILRIDHSFGKAVGVVTRVTVDYSGWSPQWKVGVQFLTMQVAQRRGVFVSVEG